MLDQFVFVSGAPRSGTTYISDWLTQLPDTYCVHEVLADLKDCPEQDVMPALLDYARTGQDRHGKALQHEFLSWPDGGLEKADPRVLGWKEPITWGRGGIPAAPRPLGEALRDHCQSCVFTVRHPFDVVASGRRREARTSNWRPLTAEEHCGYWLSAFDMIRELTDLGKNVLVLRWEDLISDPDTGGAQLGELVGTQLPSFSGYERNAEELRSFRECVDPARGLAGHPSRVFLTSDDEREIRKVLATEAAEFGYEL